MATYKVIHAPKTYQTARDVENVISYITSTNKTRENGIIGGAVLPENAADAMNIVTDAYYKETGPRIRHSVLSFSPDDPISFDQVREIAMDCVDYYKDYYQMVAAIHEDRDYLHIHFAMNTTSYVNGSKYHGEKKDYYGFIKHANQYTAPYGIIVKPGESREDEEL